MQLSEIKTLFKEASKQYHELSESFDEKDLEIQLKNKEELTFASDFWNDQVSASKIIKEVRLLKNELDLINKLTNSFEELELCYELSKDDEESRTMFIGLLDEFNKVYETAKIHKLFSGEFDDNDVILEIHPGAGGTESQDWAMMLYRMYIRFTERSNYKYTLINYLAGDEAGLKSVMIKITGDKPYGYFKSENGVHRLVRISPFDSAKRRHTSFASVSVMPDVSEDIDIEILETDLKIDTFRSSGAGGQSVNTTDSAVRITHLPSKIVVSCQNERSQIKNRETAMKILKGKLYQLEQQKLNDKQSAFRQSSQNAFGSQIRSYVMHPYMMVKDHRTNYETGNVSKVLDGELTGFINAYLMNDHGGNNES